MVKKSRNKGKYRLINFEGLISVYEAYSGYLFVDTFVWRSDRFIMAVALLRKCCGYTFRQIDEVYKLGNLQPYSEALRVHSNKVCKYSPEYDVSYVLKYKLIVSNCKYFAPTLSGYERLKRYRAKRRKK